MRTGRPVEVLLDAAVANIKTTAQRLGCSALSEKDYDRHGSFPVSTITKRWRWSYLCTLAGVRYGRQKKPKRPCIEGCGRMNMPTKFHCWACYRRIQRLANKI